MRENKVAVVGIGTWGKNILRAVNDLCEVVAIGYGGSDDTRHFIETHYPHIHSGTDLDLIAQNPLVDAVFIATPIANHFEHTKLFLEQGKHVLIEKPMACTEAEVNELYKIAQDQNLTLCTGYIYLFDKAIQELKNLTDKKKGTLESHWEKWGSFHSPMTTNLLVHEIALAHYLLGPLLNIRKENKEEDMLEIHTKHERGDAGIYIDRGIKEKRKFMTFITEDKNTYMVEKEVLTKDVGGILTTLYDNPQPQLLTSECSAFIEMTQYGSQGNIKRQQIDISVARVLQELV